MLSIISPLCTLSCSLARDKCNIFDSREKVFQFGPAMNCNDMWALPITECNGRKQNHHILSTIIIINLTSAWG